MNNDKLASDKLASDENLATDTSTKSYLEINYNFTSPIEYGSKTKILDKNISETLELVESIEEAEIPIYQHIFSAKNKPTELSVKQFAKFYTTDTIFLENTQQIIQSINPDKIKKENNINSALEYYEEIKQETSDSFHSKYLYFDHDFVKSLNTNPLVLAFTSIYNLTSPIISLCIPILILILPLIIIKLSGDNFDLTKYLDILKPLIQKTSIGRLFVDFNDSSDPKKVYLFLSAFFYCFSTYQNILSCIKFYSNIKRINDYLLTFKTYLSDTISNMEYFNSIIYSFNTYDKFNYTLLSTKNVLSDILNEINDVSEFKFNFKKITELGNNMAIFYKIYTNTEYDEAFLYSFGFNGYLTNLLQINEHLTNDKLHKAKFITDVTPEEDHAEEPIEEKELTNNELKEEENVEQNVEEPIEESVGNKIRKTKLIAENIFYPKYINDEGEVVKNDCNLDKNIILTGPNASGKTTFIKSLFLNILLSQQIGYGCFSKLNFIPYNYFHCYLNIPDTSGRDSLFQAEARRCKNILNFIKNNSSDETHFCIFDELYSGTNPDDAITSAGAFIKYISSLTNVSFSLTTHYVNLCKKINNHPNIQNCKMKTTIDEETKNVNYVYVIENGISQVKNGIQILKNMNYPDVILNQII